MYINPCTFYEDAPNILFNRNIVLITIIAYFAVFLLIKILHLYKNQTSAKIESILNQKEKQAAFKINIENIEHCENAEATEIYLNKENEKGTK